MAALAELPLYAIAIVCLGLAAILVLLVYALFKGLIDLLNLIPRVNIGTAWLETTKQAIWHALGVAFHGIDAALGWQIHNMARLTSWLWREFKAHSLIAALLAALVANLVHVYHRLEHGVRDLTHGAYSIYKRLARFERELHGIEHGVRDLSRYVHRVIGHDVLPEIRSLDRELTHIESKVIPDIRAIAQGAEHDVTALRKWITDNIPLIGTTALVGAVAWALSALGLGGLRCPTFLNLLKKRGCGLGSLLDALLGLAISALALENVCTLLPILEAAFGEVVGPVTRLLTEVPLGGCETPPAGWAKLSVAAGPLPPPQTLGALAA